MLLLNKIPEIYFPILKIVRQELNDKIKKEDNPNIIKIKSNNHSKHDLTVEEEKILNDIKDCIPNLSLSTVSVLSEMFGYSVGCKRKITELEDRISELEEKLNSKNSD